MPYKCPASGCTRSFSTPKGLNWYKAGKCRELDREEDDSMNEDPLEGLPDGIADEVDDELFQLIPLGGQGE